MLIRRIFLVFSLLVFAHQSTRDVCGQSRRAPPPLPPADAPLPRAGQGAMVGEVTDRSALVQLRLTASDTLTDGDVPGAWGVAEFRLRASGADQPIAIASSRAFPERDFICRVAFDELSPSTHYVCETRIGLDAKALRPGPTVEFTTHPGKTSGGDVSFVVVTGMNYARFYGDHRNDRAKNATGNNRGLPPGDSGPDRTLGYPALVSILQLKPDFFVGTGDNVYYDTPSKPRAQTVPEMRRKWHEQFIQSRYHDLFAVVPTYWMVDDHDYRIDDADNTGLYRPLPETGRSVLLEQLPYASFEQPAAKTYRTHRVSRDLQVWFPENRFYRSPNGMPDGPGKTIWGEEQRAWLKRTLVQSDATFKLLISPTPMIGPDDLRKTDNHCDVRGFQYERDEFFRFLKENGLDQQNFFIVCGDRHWQYHAVDPSGFEEFSCGALVDANSRLGRMPGDPKGTDPEGRIKHLHTQTEPSGGFLRIRCQSGDAEESARLRFEFYDEKGTLLYEHQKVPLSQTTN